MTNKIGGEAFGAMFADEPAEADYERGFGTKTSACGGDTDDQFDGKEGDL